MRAARFLAVLAILITLFEYSSYGAATEEDPIAWADRVSLYLETHVDEPIIIPASEGEGPSTASWITLELVLAGYLLWRAKEQIRPKSGISSDKMKRQGAAILVATTVMLAVSLIMVRVSGSWGDPPEAINLFSKALNVWSRAHVDLALDRKIFDNPKLQSRYQRKVPSLEDIQVQEKIVTAAQYEVQECAQNLSALNALNARGLAQNEYGDPKTFDPSCRHENFHVVSNWERFKWVTGVSVSSFFGAAILAYYALFLKGRLDTVQRIQMPSNPQHYYNLVSEELQADNYDQGLWTRALAETDGDEKRAVSTYIRYRVTALRSKLPQESLFTEAQSAHTFPNSDAWDPNMPRPWRRFWARFLDYQIYSLALLPVMIPAWSNHSVAHALIFGLLIGVPCMAVIEAGLLAWTGTTLGKCLLGLRVTTQDGTRLPFDKALSRYFAIYWRLVTFVPCFIAYSDLSVSSGTKWDIRGGFVVSSTPISGWRWLAYAVIWIAVKQISVFCVPRSLVERILSLLPH